MRATPEPTYNAPIFMFQLGGNDTQSIALLDISPTLPAMDYGPLLHRQYGPLDEDLFMEAAREYLRVWIEHYYRPGAAHTRQEDVASATSAIHRYKKILHESDPAHGIFSKASGRKVADAFMYLETRDYPALEAFG